MLEDDLFIKPIEEEKPPEEPKKEKPKRPRKRRQRKKKVNPAPKEEKKDNPEGERILGSTVSFEDYNLFQRTEATASDLESLVMLERAIAKGEIRKPGEFNVGKWVGAGCIIMIVAVICLYLAKDFGLF